MLSSHGKQFPIERLLKLLASSRIHIYSFSFIKVRVVFFSVFSHSL